MSQVVFHKDGDRQIAINIGHAVSAQVVNGRLVVRWRDGGETYYTGELAARLWTKLTTGVVDLRTGQTFCEGVPYPEPPRIEVDNDGQMKKVSDPKPADGSSSPKSAYLSKAWAESAAEIKAQIRAEAKAVPASEAKRAQHSRELGFEVVFFHGCAYFLFGDGAVRQGDVSTIVREGDVMAVSLQSPYQTTLKFKPRFGDESAWDDVRFRIARDLRKFLWEVDQLPPQEREAWEIYYTSMGRLGC